MTQTSSTGGCLMAVDHDCVDLLAENCTKWTEEKRGCLSRKLKNVVKSGCCVSRLKALVALLPQLCLCFCTGSLVPLFTAKVGEAFPFVRLLTYRIQKTLLSTDSLIKEQSARAEPKGVR